MPLTARPQFFLPLVALALLLDTPASRGQAKKGGDLLVPDPLELKAGNPLSPLTLVSQPPALKGAVGWTVEPKRHRGVCASIAVSPDGALVATGGNDGAIRIWNVADAALDRILIGHTQGVAGMAFSPDGAVLASTGGDATLRLWNPKTGMTLRVLRKHKGATSRVDWSPDGDRLVVSGGSSGFATFWMPAQSKQLHTVEHGKGVTCVAWSPDGKTVATTTADGVSLWSAEDGMPLGTLKPPGNVATAVAWSADSATLAVGNATGLSLWKVADKEMTNQFPGAAVYLSWSPDGKHLAASSGAAVSLWNAQTWAAPRTVAVVATSMDWDRKSERLFVGGPQDVTIIDPAGEQSNRTINVAAAGVPLWSPGRPILTGLSTTTLQSWDPQTGRPEATFAGHTGRVDVVEWSRDGRHLATGSVDKTARIWEPKGGKMLHVLGGHGDYVTSLAWAPDGRLATGCRDKTVRVFGTDRDAPPKQLTGHTFPVRSVAWTREGGGLVSGGGDGVIFVWDLAKGQPAKKVTIDKEKDILDLAFSPDGRLLAAGCIDANIRLFAVPSWKLVSTLGNNVGNAGFYQLAWSNNAQQLMANAQMWDVKTAAVVRPFYLAGTLNTVAWSADNRTVVACCHDRCVRFCDATTTRVRATMLHEPKQVSAVSADGNVRTTPDLETELVYVVQTDKSQDTYEPKAFAAKFGWRNNPALVRP